MARGLEQGNMKHFVVSPAGDFLAFQGRLFNHLGGNFNVQLKMQLLYTAALLKYSPDDQRVITIEYPVLSFEFEGVQNLSLIS